MIVVDFAVTHLKIKLIFRFTNSMRFNSKWVNYFFFVEYIIIYKKANSVKEIISCYKQQGAGLLNQALFSL